MACLIQAKQTVLFQGDSITDAGRRDDGGGLGSGYVRVAVSMFRAMQPALDVNFINRGISGNRVKDMKERWTEDCIDLKPDWVSIMIGINDTWRRFDKDDPTTAEAYEEGYRSILTRVRDELGARILIFEPFLLPVDADKAGIWREDLDPKIQAARRLAREFDAVYVPLDGLFAAACHEAEPAYWAQDGVHPSPAGAGLIARAWLEAVKA